MPMSKDETEPTYVLEDNPVADRRQPKLIKWVPNFDAGTLAVIITIGTGIFYFGGELRQQRADLEAYRAAAAVEAAHFKESLSGVAMDVKAIQGSVGDMKETLAVIKATQQDRRLDGTPAKR